MCWNRRVSGHHSTDGEDTWALTEAGFVLVTDHVRPLEHSRLWGVVLFTEPGVWEGWGAGANPVKGALGPPGVTVGS